MNTLSQKKHGHYMVGLDSLRGIAILGVVLYHINFKWMPGGFLGVTVFFVLSGYLITDILAMEWQNTGRINLKRFWLRRARRLLPGMFFMLSIIISWITIFHFSLLEQVRGDFLAAILYFSNWWYIYHKLSYFESFNTIHPLNHFWSLAVEEQFYLIWPFIVALGFYYIKKRSRLALFIFLAAVISAILMAIKYVPGIDPSRIYYGTDTRLFSLLIGSVLALLWPSNRLSKKIIPLARFILDVTGGIGLIVILVMFWKTNQYDPFLYRGGMFFLSITTALLVANLAHPASRISVILRFKPLRWIGVRSYGIYLWHYPIITLSHSQVNIEQFQYSKALFQVCMILIMAQLSWKYIENPIRQGALQNVQLSSLRLRSITFKYKVILICTLSLALTDGFGLLAVNANHPKEQLKKQTISTKGDKLHQNNNKKEAISTPAKEDFTISAIGDSIMIDISPFLEEIFPEIKIDAKVGRQMSQAFDIAKKMDENGTLGNHIIIGLGTNGAFTTEQIEKLIHLIGNERKIILVNTRVSRPWESLVNERIKDVASKYTNITLIDWYTASAGQQSYFEPDGIHLNEEGAKAYALLLKKNIIDAQ
ncbi:acyltransferase family protein [Bacillus thuringiensis]|uniref:acyltransferase family protein n=1 Tax=Bacillus thuringiensis TaxID=1428 RepID=UPI000CF9E975|nr:acyltransferase family protein [Bacillus thuringiensis]PQQ47540.1 acetyltransferase [Bacillus thuringiensis]